MRRSIAAVANPAWVLLAVLVGVLGVGAANLWWPPTPLSVKVLGINEASPAASTTSSGNSGCGNGNGGANGLQDCSNAGHPITVTGGVLNTLFPGVTGTLRVSVTNPNNQDLTITSVTPTIGTPNKSGCLSSWFTAAAFNGSKTVAKNSSTYVDLNFTMLDKPVKQDACMGATVPVSFTATATGA